MWSLRLAILLFLRTSCLVEIWLWDTLGGLTSLHFLNDNIWSIFLNPLSAIDSNHNVGNWHPLRAAKFFFQQVLLI